MGKVELFIGGEKVYESQSTDDIDHVHFKIDGQIMVSYER